MLVKSIKDTHKLRALNATSHGRNTVPTAATYKNLSTENWLYTFEAIVVSLCARIVRQMQNIIFFLITMKQ